MPAAAIIRALGQRNGFMTGGLVTALAAPSPRPRSIRASFWLFAFGLLVIGLGGAFVQQYRFAAADNAPPEFKARAISFVLAGGVFTAIVGPQVVIFTRELLAPVMFAGSFVAVIFLALIGMAILFLLRLPAKRAAVDGQCRRRAAGAAAVAKSSRSRASSWRCICAVGSFCLMSFVMTGAPLAMVGCGFSPDEATLGISWHVMAMFGPSFFTGRLIARFGKERIVAFGLLLLVGCALVALSGIALWQFWTSLILLGLGWNFGFIGATAMVAETYRRQREGQGPGLPRLRAVRLGRLRLADVGQGLQRLGLGHAELGDIPGRARLPCRAGGAGAARAARAGLALRPPPHLRASFKRLWRQAHSAAFPQIAA